MIIIILFSTSLLNSLLSKAGVVLHAQFVSCLWCEGGRLKRCLLGLKGQKALYAPTVLSVSTLQINCKLILLIFTLGKVMMPLTLFLLNRAWRQNRLVFCSGSIHCTVISEDWCCIKPLLNLFFLL